MTKSCTRASSPSGCFAVKTVAIAGRRSPQLKALPQSVRKNWWYPQAPHHGHVRNIHIHPDDPNTIYLVPRTWRHRAQLRSRQDLGRCQQGHRLSRHSRHREFTQAQGSLLRRQRARLFHQRQTGRRLGARRERTDTRLLSRFSFLAAGARRRAADDAARDRRRFARFLAPRKPRRPRGDVQKHRRRAIVDAHHRTGSPTISTR